jgi:tetratricopeptide (TPR) repeat protein
LETNPGFLEALNNKGSILNNKLKKHKEAIDCFDKILEINPKNVFVLANKSRALYSWENSLSDLAKMKTGIEAEELLRQSADKRAEADEIKKKCESIK